jgi:hypothetical protein
MALILIVLKNSKPSVKSLKSRAEKSQNFFPLSFPTHI